MGRKSSKKVRIEKPAGRMTISPPYDFYMAMQESGTKPEDIVRVMMLPENYTQLTNKSWEEAIEKWREETDRLFRECVSGFLEDSRTTFLEMLEDMIETEGDEENE